MSAAGNRVAGEVLRKSNIVVVAGTNLIDVTVKISQAPCHEVTENQLARSCRAGEFADPVLFAGGDEPTALWIADMDEQNAVENATAK